MININALKGEIAKNGKSQLDIAEHLGMTPKTFYAKMKKGVFDSDEIFEMIKFLSISNPIEIFFVDKSLNTLQTKEE